jgi:chromosomal replication initiator protein
MVSAEQVWQHFLDIVRQEKGSRIVETWLKAVVLERWDMHGSVVYLRAPNQFVQDWVCSNYKNLFKEHLSRLFAVDTLDIVFLENLVSGHAKQVVPARRVQDEHRSRSHYQEITPSLSELVSDKDKGEQVQKESAGKSVVPALSSHCESQNDALDLVVSRGVMPHKSFNVNAGYTFDTFVAGPSNSLAYAAAQAVTHKPGLVYNPLFVYGRSGLGKTHLLHAIGNGIKKRYKRLSVLYQPADRFVNEFIHAIRFDKVDMFKEKYRSIDVLLVDDIQFIAHKDQTQEAFFHIFNTLYESSKQLVFGSDTFPKDMQGIAERLRSRLEWGLITDIQMPTIEEKVAILKQKATGSSDEISDDVAHFIASLAMTSVRELEGALIRVSAFASLTNHPIDVDLAKKVLCKTHHAHIERVTLTHILDRVAQFFSYTEVQLRSKARDKNISFARQMAMFLMKKHTDKPLQEIGKFLCRSDHSTVLYAINRVQELITRDEQARALVHQIEQKLYIA